LLIVAASILFLVSGAPFLFCGYLIAIKKKTSIIAGWDDSNIKDPHSYAKVFGWTGILIGSLLGGCSFLFAANTISIVMFFTALMMSVIAQLFAGAFCKSRYGK